MSNKEHIGLDGAVSQGTSRGVQLADSARNGPAVKSGMMRGCFLRPLLQPACGLIATTMSADSSSPSPAPASVDAAATGAGRARRGGKRQRPRNPAPAATTPDAAPGVAKAPRTPHPVLEQLAGLYPHLFGAVFRPLKRGIFQDLLAAHPDAFEREALKVALGIHTRSTRYLQAVAAGEKRHDLQGQPVEAMAPEHVQPGMHLAFCQRNVTAARADLMRICAEIREELSPQDMEPAPAAERSAQAQGAAAPAPGTGAMTSPAGAAQGRTIRGAIYVSCSGRGGPHFGGPSAELQIVRHALGDVPLVGFFAGGEIAHQQLYGYTGVLTVFTDA